MGVPPLNPRPPGPRPDAHLVTHPTAFADYVDKNDTTKRFRLEKKKEKSVTKITYKSIHTIRTRLYIAILIIIKHESVNLYE